MFDFADTNDAGFHPLAFIITSLLSNNGNRHKIDLYLFLWFAEDILPSERGRNRTERPDPAAATATTTATQNRPKAKKGKRSRG